eukprot:1344633-Amorphochlora_amoeboformis.AAC.1
MESRLLLTLKMLGSYPVRVNNQMFFAFKQMSFQALLVVVTHKSWEFEARKYSQGFKTSRTSRLDLQALTFLTNAMLSSWYVTAALLLGTPMRSAVDKLYVEDT